MTTRVEISRFALLALGLVTTIGCGADDGLGQRYRVYGTVTYNGQPLPRGNISFAPDSATGRAASGVIVDGSYSLTTLDPDDGALPGQYKVSVIAKEADPSSVTVEPKRRGKMTDEQKRRYTAENPQLAALQANKLAKDLIPPKYSSPATSGIAREVKAERNQIDIDLKDE